MTPARRAWRDARSPSDAPGRAAPGAGRRTDVLAIAAIAGAAWFPAPSAGHVIAVDAGHSIATQGAISSRGVAEFEFNRALARAIETVLDGAGHRVVPIAFEGRTEDLVSRPRQAAQARAGLFVSVHHDSAKARFQRDWEFEGRSRRYLDDRFRGFSLFVSRLNSQWPLALKCAAAVGAQLQAAGYRPSRYHADPVLGSAREFADEANGVHFYDNLAVLRHATMPAFLFEAGVIVNRDEEAMLARADTRRSIAHALERGVADCGFAP